MSTEMLYPLLINMLGFGLMIGAITIVRFRGRNFSKEMACALG